MDKAAMYEMEEKNPLFGINYYLNASKQPDVRHSYRNYNRNSDTDSELEKTQECHMLDR